jgi:hypothetical protein
MAECICHPNRINHPKDLWKGRALSLPSHGFGKRGAVCAGQGRGSFVAQLVPEVAMELGDDCVVPLPLR